jgi:hypothetical protein
MFPISIFEFLVWLLFKSGVEDGDRKYIVFTVHPAPPRKRLSNFFYFENSKLAIIIFGSDRRGFAGVNLVACFITARAVLGESS